MNLGKTIQSAVRSKYFWQWVSTTVGGSLVALILTQITFSIAKRLPLLMGPGFGITLGLCLGLSAGVFQWWILHKHFHAAHEWIIATAFASVASLFLQEPAIAALSALTEANYFLVGVIASVVVTGVVIGIAQWIVLVERVKGAWVWIPTTLLAQLLVNLLSVRMSIDRTASPSIFAMVQSIAFIVGQTVLRGFVRGAITGIPMAKFIEQERKRKQKP